jgi:hypothetical protein
MLRAIPQGVDLPLLLFGSSLAIMRFSQALQRFVPEAVFELAAKGEHQAMTPCMPAPSLLPILLDAPVPLS